MKKILILILTTMTFYAMAEVNVEGTYNAKGYDPYFKQWYTGTVEIKRGANNVYTAIADWNIGDHKVRAIGKGLMTNNILAFVWQNQADKQDYGLQIYIINGNHLEGPYVEYNNSVVGKEILEKQT